MGVEAEPTHMHWMRTHFEDNRIDPGSSTLVEAAVAADNGWLRVTARAAVGVVWTTHRSPESPQQRCTMQPNNSLTA